MKKDDVKHLIHGNDERQFHAVENTACVQHVGHEGDWTTATDRIHHVNNDRRKTCRLPATHQCRISVTVSIINLINKGKQRVKVSNGYK